MSAAQALDVSTATQPGSGASPNEDRIFTTANAVVLLDGATGSAPPRTGGWYAQELGTMLVDQLWQVPELELPRVLASSIRELVERFALTAGDCPTATVAVVRVRQDMLDVLVLGDSPVVLRMADGRVLPVDDRRLQRVAVAERARLRASSEAESAAARAAVIAAEAKRRNQPGGYWIAEASPDAAFHALTLTVPASAVDAALLVSDGVAIGVDRYGRPGSWEDAHLLAQQSPATLIDHVLEAERDDPERVRWSRSKVHDDKAVAYVRLHQADL